MDGVKAEEDIIVLSKHVNTLRPFPMRDICGLSSRRHTFNSSIRTAMG
jgi:hypothetical protein